MRCSSCAIIVCDHGLGHVRRCALIAKERARVGERVTLFAPVQSVTRLRRAIPSVVGFTVSDFVTQTTPQRIKEGLPKAIEWVDRLPDLDNFDAVICDNLPEILARRPDATISAQFFWHDAVEGAAADYAEYCDHLLAKHKPTVIGCEYFSMEAVRKQPGFKPVGLYKNPELLAAAEATTLEQRTDLLVTGGTTPLVREQLVRIIDELLLTGPEPYKRVHVDPELMPATAPTWMLNADFTVEMFCKLKAAVCRPGLGVITDLLTAGATIYPVYEPGNREMTHNAHVLQTIA